MNYPVVFSGVNPLRYKSASYLPVYLLLCGAINLLCLSFKPYWGDMGYWWGWVLHLENSGYQGFDGNYPPVYVHWLYLVGKIYDFFHVLLAKDFLLKTFVELPVIFTHLFFLRIIHRALLENSQSSNYYHFVMIAASVNPAFLLDGPVWGQVDLLPSVIVTVSLYLAVTNRLALLVMPLYCIALLTKFQMICFAPVFAFLFFSAWRKHLVGILIGVVCGAIILLPFYSSGELGNILINAYVKTTGQYPYSTYNAANVWYLLDGNEVLDKEVLLQMGQIKLTAKMLGIGVFAFISLFVFAAGLIIQSQKDILEGENRIRLELLLGSLIIGIAFFLVLPGMHERYLFPVVPVALLYSAFRPKSLYIPVLITCWAFFNIILINPISGDNLWVILSLFGVLTFGVILIFEFAHKHLLERFGYQLLKLLNQFKWVPEFCVLIVSLCIIGILASKSLVPNNSDTENGVPLTDFPVRSSQQGWGTLNKDLNIDSQAMTVQGIRFSSGFGVHAPSRVEFDLPEGYSHLVGMASLDDSGRGGRVKFRIDLDKTKAWSTGSVELEDGLQRFDIELGGAKKLSLIVNALGDKNYDHANWLNLKLINRNK